MIDDRRRPETREQRRNRRVRERLTATTVAWALILLVTGLVLAGMAIQVFG